MTLQIPPNSTSVRLPMSYVNPDGTQPTGIINASSVELMQYRRGSGPAVNVTPVGALDGDPYIEGGIAQLSGGSLLVGWPDAAFAEGEDRVSLYLDLTNLRAAGEERPVIVELRSDLLGIEPTQEELDALAGLANGVVQIDLTQVNGDTTVGEQLASGGSGTGQPRINKRFGHYYIRQLSRRHDGTLEAPIPYNIGLTETPAVALDTSTIYGNGINVLSVGTPVVTPAGELQVTALGPQDGKLGLKFGGGQVAGGRYRIDTPGTMDTNEVRPYVPLPGVTHVVEHQPIDRPVPTATVGGVHLDALAHAKKNGRVPT